ncbi:MAG: OmpA family protein, partial [Solimonas sp.]
MPLVPEIGDPAGFDITLAPIEQGQLTGLTEFHNGGAIDMQDGAAGDVIAITNGVGEGVTPATYFSEGGTLLLDTVLNEGGDTESLSDVLILDATEVGAGGPTLVSINGIAGTGVQTIEDGILVVDVLNPELSASGVFELDGLVISGPWQYGLFQGGDSTTGGDPLDGNWYLRTDGLAPTTDVYRAYPSSMMRSARLPVGTLQQRVGNRWWHVPEQRTQRTVTDPAPPPQPSVRDFVVYFDWDRDEIRSDAAATIREAAEYARSGNAARVLVVGHTDTSGSADYNMALSERRARNVSNALAGEGVNAQVIGMEWLGETQPAVDTGDGVREQANRRATIQVAVPGTPDPNAAGRTRVVEDVIPASTLIQGSGVWGRIVGVDGEYQRDDDLGEIDETAFMAQFGVDFAFGESDASRYIGSVAV